MHERFEKRIEEGLRKIQTSCQKKKQKPVTIATRVGRLLGRNTRAAALFDVKAEVSGFARLRWSKVEARRECERWSEGRYVLRSRVPHWADRQVGLVNVKRRLGLRQLDVGPPQILRTPIRHSERAPRAGAHPGLLPELCAVEDPGCELPAGGTGDEQRRSTYASVSPVRMRQRPPCSIWQSSEI
jgi:hypothetical protein